MLVLKKGLYRDNETNDEENEEEEEAEKLLWLPGYAFENLGVLG